jgi:hypothetical protein
MKDNSTSQLVIVICSALNQWFRTVRPVCVECYYTFDNTSSFESVVMTEGSRPDLFIHHIDLRCSFFLSGYSE